MNKLVERFEKINSRMLSQHGNAISSAEEAKKLAQNFLKYYLKNGGKFSYEETEDEIFNQFLEDYYK